MSWQKFVAKVSFVLAVIPLTACGVKGDPLPPEQPPSLGRGRPTYRRATEDLKVIPRAPVKDPDELDEERDED